MSITQLNSNKSNGYTKNSVEIEYNIENSDQNNKNVENEENNVSDHVNNI